LPAVLICRTRYTKIKLAPNTKHRASGQVTLKLIIRPGATTPRLDRPKEATMRRAKMRRVGRNEFLTAALNSGLWGPQAGTHETLVFGRTTRTT
jgi:hypothetical protein